MADALRRLSALASQMRRGGAEPDFFELVRRMDWQHPALPRTGCAAHLSQEPLRFAQAPYLKFPETTIAAIAPSIPEAPGTARITLYAFGLWGVNGPMPLELTSWVFQRAHNHFDFTAQAFADIIHHRFISLFVRAWAQNEEAAQHDRPADDLTGAAVCALAGDPTGAASRESAGRLGGEEPMPEGVLPAGLSRSFARFLGRMPRSSDGLEKLLAAWTDFPVRVRSSGPEAFDIPKRYRAQLGRESVCRLGRNAQIGRRAYSSSRRFEAALGPMCLERALSLMPGRAGFEALAALVERFVDRPLAWDLIFLVKRSDVPPLALGRGAALGRSAWASSEAWRAAQSGGVVRIRICASEATRRARIAEEARQRRECAARNATHGAPA